MGTPAAVLNMTCAMGTPEASVFFEPQKMAAMRSSTGKRSDAGGRRAKKIPRRMRGAGPMDTNLDQSTVILRGLTRSDFGSVTVSTPWLIFADTLLVSIAGSNSNTRR